MENKNTVFENHHTNWSEQTMLVYIRAGPKEHDKFYLTTFSVFQNDKTHKNDGYLFSIVLIKPMVNVMSFFLQKKNKKTCISNIWLMLCHFTTTTTKHVFTFRKHQIHATGTKTT